jgi:hypothetical protein
MREEGWKGIGMNAFDAMIALILVLGLALGVCIRPRQATVADTAVPTPTVRPLATTSPTVPAIPTP